MVNVSSTAGILRIPIDTGSNATAEYRLTFYTGNDVDFKIWHSGQSYHPQYRIDGGSLVAGTTTALTNGFHQVAFSSSMDWGTNGTNVGLYFTNGTATTGDVAYIRDIHLMNVSQSLVVDNAGGFVPGEIVVAKSTDQGPDDRQGFVREYMRVQSSSLGASETPASGTVDFGSTTINASTILYVTASKNYTFTGVSTATPDITANND